MTDPNPALRALSAEYKVIAEMPTKDLSPDQRRGIAYYLADIEPDRASEPHVTRWIHRLHDLDRFVAEHGRMPRMDSHRPRRASHEQMLADAVSYYRQVGTTGGYCDYQRRRLESIPGFAWNPRDQAWEDLFRDHQLFWARYGAAPRRRSADPDEVRIGRWVAQQRGHFRAGTLLAKRERILRQARYRVL